MCVGRGVNQLVEFFPRVASATKLFMPMDLPSSHWRMSTAISWLISVTTAAKPIWSWRGAWLFTQPTAFPMPEPSPTAIPSTSPISPSMANPLLCKPGSKASHTVTSSGNSFTVADRTYVFDGDKIVAKHGMHPTAAAPKQSNKRSPMLPTALHCAGNKVLNAKASHAATCSIDASACQTCSKALDDHRGFRHTDPVVSKQAATFWRQRRSHQPHPCWMKQDPTSLPST